MNEKQWRDEDIEQMLNKMPAVEDTRSKEDVFAKLQQAGAFEEEKEINQQPNSKNKKSRAPFYLSISAAVVAAIAVVPTFFTDNTSNNESTLGMQDANESSIEMESADQSSEMSVRMFDVANTERFAVYEEDTAYYKTIPVIKSDALPVNVPMTLLIPIDQVVADFGSDDPSTIELIEVYESLLSNLQVEFVGEQIKQSAPYALYDDGERRYLALDIAQSNRSAVVALQQMPEISDGLISAIPVGVTYTVTENQQQLDITFTEPLNLDALAVEDALYMIEAINLTAANYGKSVQLHNIVQSEWQNFIFSQPLPTVIGPNRLSLQ